jgi:hypothetical protein
MADPAKKVEIGVVEGVERNVSQPLLHQNAATRAENVRKI